MKKIVTVCMLVALPAFASTAAAQVKDEIKQDAKKVGHEVKKGATTAGNKTAEVASKGASKVADQEYKDKVGPNGETIYIDKHAKYYWVDGKGHHRYISESALKAK